MRTLKTIGFVAACVIPMALLLVISLLQSSSPADIKIPPTETPKLEEAAAVETQDHRLAFNYPKPLPGLNPREGHIRWVYAGPGEVLDADDGHWRKEYLPASENDRDADGSYRLRYVPAESSELSYNPELRRMGVYMGEDGVPHYGTPENPGPVAGWEVLHRKQHGDDNTGK